MYWTRKKETLKFLGYASAGFKCLKAKRVWVVILLITLLLVPSRVSGLQKENISAKPFSRGLHELCHLSSTDSWSLLEHCPVCCFTPFSGSLGPGPWSSLSRSPAFNEVLSMRSSQFTFFTDPIHLIPKWPPFKYSLVFLQISPCRLVLKLEIQKNVPL